jgi:hypothetical protein
MSETSRHHRSIRVPAAQAAAVLEALVTTYAVKADALAAAAGAYQDAREPLAVVNDARRELAEAEDALEALGWRPGPPGGDLELAGPAGLVREVLYGALLGAAEAVGERCRDYEAGRADDTALATAVADVAALHRLFAALEAAEGL